MNKYSYYHYIVQIILFAATVTELSIIVGNQHSTSEGISPIRSENSVPSNILDYPTDILTGNMSDTSPFSSAPDTPTDSTPASSVASPELSTLTLKEDVSEEDKLRAGEFKAEANKAFTSMRQ
jgi:hypothetical protein